MTEKRASIRDSYGYSWTYYSSGLLKLDNDDTEDGGFSFATLAEAREFLEEYLGVGGES